MCIPSAAVLEMPASLPLILRVHFLKPGYHVWVQVAYSVSQVVLPGVQKPLEPESLGMELAAAHMTLLRIAEEAPEQQHRQTGVLPESLCSRCFSACCRDHLKNILWLSSVPGRTFSARFCHLSRLHLLLLHAQQPAAGLQPVNRSRLTTFPAQVTQWKLFCQEFRKVAESFCLGF